MTRCAIIVTTNRFILTIISYNQDVFKIDIKLNPRVSILMSSAGTRSGQQMWPVLRHLRDIIKELAIIMAANIVKSWHSFSIKCLYFPSQ